MKDKFKLYLDQHKNEIDGFYEEDFESIWKNVSGELNSRNKRPRAILLKIAATLLAFMIIGYIAYQVGHYNGYVSQELAEAETHYMPMISKKMSLIQTHHGKIDALIWEDMRQIDQACKELKNDLKDQVDNEEVINAIIQNYRIKLNILDQLLEEIENKGNEDKETSTDI